MITCDMEGYEFTQAHLTVKHKLKLFLFTLGAVLGFEKICISGLKFEWTWRNLAQVDHNTLYVRSMWSKLNGICRNFDKNWNVSLNYFGLKIIRITFTKLKNYKNKIDKNKTTKTKIIKVTNYTDKNTFCGLRTASACCHMRMYRALECEFDNLIYLDWLNCQKRRRREIPRVLYI